MYGLLAWTIYATLASTRLTNALLSQPLQIDPFDLSPFEPIGRQSLLNALVFVGGISLSLILISSWTYHHPLIILVHYILNGTNVSYLEDDQLAEIRNKEIGFVFQTFNLLSNVEI